MAFTVGRKWLSSRPNGGVDTCDYCGAKFPVSKLIRKRGGKLACEWDAKGMDEVECAEANFAAQPGPMGHSRRP